MVKWGQLSILLIFVCTWRAYSQDDIYSRIQFKNQSKTLSGLLNKESCYEELRSFVGCVAVIDKLAKLNDKKVFLNEGLYQNLELSIEQSTWVEQYSLNFESKYFIKTLLSQLYHQNEPVKFAAYADIFNRKYKVSEFLDILNIFYRYTYDYHSYLEPVFYRDYLRPPVHFSSYQNKLFVQYVHPFSGASHQKIQKGDQVLKINDRAVSEFNTNDLNKVFYTKESTFLKIQLSRANDIWDIYLTTKKDFGTWKALSEETFYARPAEISKKTYEKLRSSLELNKVSNLILDLRSLDGGDATQALEMAAMTSQDNLEIELIDIRTKELTKIKPELSNRIKINIIVLIDEQTKSAAEILAGLISINPQAVVLGQTSYGKGSVQIAAQSVYSQQLIEWKTKAFYRLPSWGVIQKTGIKPDITIGETPIWSKRENDYFLSLNDEKVEVLDREYSFERKMNIERSKIIHCIDNKYFNNKFEGEDIPLHIAEIGIECFSK